MAKKDEFDDLDNMNLDDLDLNKLDKMLDGESDFSADIQDDKPKGKRIPITEFGKGVADSVKGLKISIPAITSDIDRAFPKTSGLFRTATGTLSDLTALKNEVVADLAPNINQLKQTTRRLLPKIEGILPKKIYDKVYDKLAPKDIYSSGSVEEAREEVISQQLGAVFGAQQAQDREDRKQDRTDKYIDRALQKTDQQETVDQLSSIRQSSYITARFSSTTLKGYLKKSLELKYRHLFVAQDTLALTKTMASSLDVRLKDIAHNTALPEHQKKYKTEAFKEHTQNLLLGKVSGSVGDWASNFGERVLKNVSKLAKEKISEFKDSIGMLSDGLDQYADVSEMEKDIGGGDSSAKSLGKIVGSAALTKGARMVLAKGLNKLKQHGVDVENLSEDVKSKIMYYIKDKSNAGDSMFWNFLGDNVFPQLKDERGESNKMLARSALEEIPFDVLTRRSIVEIIPGYLAKILKTTSTLAAGKEVPELAYDINKEDFVTIDDYKQNLMSKYFGTKTSRTKEITEGVGKLLGAYSLHGGDTDAFYESMEDVVKFLNNSAKHLQRIDPKKIKAIIDGEDVDDLYDDLVFKDVKDKDRLLEILQQALYKGDKVDTDTKHSLNIFTDRLARQRDDRLIPRLAKAGAFGTRRYHTDLLDEKDMISHKKIRDQYADVDMDMLKEAVSPEAALQKERLRKAEERRAKERAYMRGENVDMEDDQARPFEERVMRMFEDENYYNKPTSIYGKLKRNTGEQRIAKLIKRELRRKNIKMTVNLQQKLYDIVKGVSSKYDQLSSDELRDKSVDIVEEVLEKLIETGGNISDTPLKDVAHVSGPGVYVQESSEEMHIPLDDSKSPYWKLLGDTITTSIQNVKGGSSNKINLSTTDELLVEIYNAISALPEAIAGHSGIFSKILKGSSTMAGKYLSTISRMYSGMFSAAGSAASYVGSKIPTILEAGGKALGHVGVGVGRALGGAGVMAGGMFSGAGNFLKGVFDTDSLDLGFTDIYGKHNGTDKPLITLAQLKKGLVTKSGKLIKSLKDLIEPVYDPETGEQLISQEDIDAGLITAAGELIGSIRRKGSSVIKGMGRALGSAATSVWNLGNKALGNGLDIYKTLFDISTNIVKSIGSGTKELFKKVMGFGEYAGSSLSKKDTKELITSRLDAIFDLLDERLERKVSGDLDNDGDREGSYQDYLQKRKEEREYDKKSPVSKLGSKARSAGKGLLGAFGLGGAASAASSRLDEKEQAQEDNESEDNKDGVVSDAIKGSVGTTLGLATAGYLKNKFPKIASLPGRAWTGTKKVAKSVLKGTGTILGKASSAIGTKLSDIGTKIGEKATSTATKAGANSGNKSFMSKAGEAVKTKFTKATAKVGEQAAESVAAKVGTKTASKVATSAAAKAVGKSSLRVIGSKIPIVGALIGAGFAANYARKGQWGNAALAMGSGIASTFGPLGIAASFALDGILIGRELSADATPTDSDKDITIPVRESVYKTPKDKREVTLSLEKWTAAALDKRQPTDTDGIRSFAKQYGLNPDKQDQMSFFYTWYKERFVRATSIFRAIAQANNVDITSVGSLPEEQQISIAKMFKEQANKAISLDLRYIPSLVGFVSYTNSVDLGVAPYKSQKLETPNIAPVVKESASHLSEKELISMGILYKELGGDVSVELTHTKIDHIFALRLKAYGLFDKDDLHDEVYALEAWASYENSKPSDRYTRHSTTSIVENMEYFGLKKNNVQQRKFFVDWFRNRFYPVFAFGRVLAEQMHTTLDEIPSLPEEHRSAFVKQYVNIIRNIQCDTGIIPTEEAFNIYMKRFNISPDKTNDKTNQQKGSTTPTLDKPKSTWQKIKDKVKDTLTGDQLVTKTPVPVDDGSLGWLSAQEESSKAGSEAIGYDKNGGTSYGKYQLSSKAGTFDKFLEWVEQQPGGEEISSRLRAAGSPDTGSKMGNVPSEWKKLAKEDKLGNFEHDFIKLTHYDDTFNKIKSPELKDRIHNSKLLREALWSTSVQHGGRAAEIFNKVYEDGMTEQDFITDLYAERGTRFGSSNLAVQASVQNRFKRESSTLLNKYKEQESLANNTSDQSAVDKTIDKVVSTHDRSATYDSSIPAVHTRAPMDQQQIAEATLVSKVTTPRVVDPRTPENLNVIAKVEPDIEQRKIVQEQVTELKKMNQTMFIFNTSMQDALGKGGVFTELNNNIVKNGANSKPNIVQIDAKQLSTITNMSSTNQGIDLRKRA